MKQKWQCPGGIRLPKSLLGQHVSSLSSELRSLLWKLLWSAEQHLCPAHWAFLLLSASHRLMLFSSFLEKAVRHLVSVVSVCYCRWWALAWKQVKAEQFFVTGKVRYSRIWRKVSYSFMYTIPEKLHISSISNQPSAMNIAGDSLLSHRNHRFYSLFS